MLTADGGAQEAQICWVFCYTAPSRGAEYCDERVRVSVTLCCSASVSPKLIRYSSIFKTRAYYGHGYVLFWRRVIRDVLSTRNLSGNM